MAWCVNGNAEAREQGAVTSRQAVLAPNPQLPHRGRLYCAHHVSWATIDRRGGHGTPAAWHTAVCGPRRGPPLKAGRSVAAVVKCADVTCGAALTPDAWLICIYSPAWVVTHRNHVITPARPRVVVQALAMDRRDAAATAATCGAGGHSVPSRAEYELVYKCALRAGAVRSTALR